MNKLILTALAVAMLGTGSATAQTAAQPAAQPAAAPYWQQSVRYKIDVDLDHNQHRLEGKMRLEYTNHSPDALDEIFMHLYWNAFQPGSMMSNMANIPTQFKDKAIGTKIQDLKPHEEGEQIVRRITHNGLDLAFDVNQTILHARLDQPIAPGATHVFELEYTTRIPIVIERAGRSNKEGVDYSFTQWYPKMCVYDRDGWHPDLYVAREFYGDFGRFEVNVTADAGFVLGGTGVLQNPSEIGHGYSDTPVKHKKKSRITWRFAADNVHDFAWTADRNYRHQRFMLPSGTEIHYYYQPDEKSRMMYESDRFRADIATYFAFMNEHFGPYRWPQFSVIQGGEGAMEYPMCTLMESHGDDYLGTFSVVAHEGSHMWFYGQLATDEQRYHWMDEGFTSFAEDEVMNVISGANKPNPHEGYLSTFAKRAAKAAWREPASTPANYFDGKFPYQMAAYMMGSLYLVQLRGIVGDDAFWRTMRRYFDEWSFKHPRPEDFVRIAERESGLVLDWYHDQWINTTKYPDVGIDSVWSDNRALTTVRLERRGSMAMPVDVKVTFESGASLTYTIPLAAMHGHKRDPQLVLAGPWNYTQKTFDLVIDAPLKGVRSIEVDPGHWTADVNRDDNVWPQAASN
ncbi:MAG: M1 family metallopeptidase [Schleiferiaceae bacterium]